MSTSYMTVKLNLTDGTIIYPQVSLDNIVASISDPTLVTVATLSGSTVPTSELPVVTNIPEAGSATDTTIPTAAAVRGLIDGKQDTLVAGIGTQIINGSTVMFNGTTLDISVIDTNESNGISLTLRGNTIGATAVLAGSTAGVPGVVAGATNGVQIDSNGIVQFDVSTVAKKDGDTAGVLVDVGDGLLVDGGTASIDDASVEDVLVGLEGGTAAINDEVVTPGNLRGALSVSQAVDVTCNSIFTGSSAFATIQYNKDINGNPTGDDTEYTWNDTQVKSDRFLGTFTLRATASSGAHYHFGFPNGSSKFPKWASGLKYLLICDVKNVGIALESGYLLPGSASYVISGAQRALTGTQLNAGQTTYTRLAVLMTANGTGEFICWTPESVSEGTIAIEMTNWRQYEVTALTDEAIQYLAQLENPDDFFRAISVFQVRDKYLVKQDMVCPWIYTIGMPDDSDLTVAAGLSYKIKYTNDNPHKITVDTIPTDAYGWDTHIQMFIKGTSSVIFQHPLILMDALTPNAGHNLVVKYRNGDALVYVEDTNAGNIVVAATGTTAGTLNYFLQQAPGEGQENYIIFAPSTDGSVCDAGTVSVAYNTDVLGNGTDKTTITGTYTVASDKTMNLQDLVVSGSTFGGSGTTVLTSITVADDMEVVSGGTVAFSGINNINSTVSGAGTIAFANGAVLNGTGVIMPAVGIVLTAGSTVSGSVTIDSTTASTAAFSSPPNNCTISGFTITGTHGAFGLSQNGTYTTYINDVLVTGVTQTQGATQAASLRTNATITGCTFSNNRVQSEIYIYSLSAGQTPCHTTINSSFFNSTDVTRSILVHRGTVEINDSFLNKTFTVNATAPQPQYVVIKLSGSTANGGFESSQAGPQLICTGSNVINVAVPATFNMQVAADGTLSGTGYIAASTFKVTETMIANPVLTIEGLQLRSPLDASAASTVKLSGATFTSASLISGTPMRIQLPAATTVSTSGNTNSSSTKILQAAIIVVGNDATAPAGSATVVNSAGSSAVVSGIGTYVANDGSNDFTTAITSVTTSDGLVTALAGANRWVKVSNGLATSMTAATATAVVDKRIITNEYEPVLGGTFTVGSGAAMVVDEATKTTSIDGGSFVVYDVDYISKLNGTGNVSDICTVSGTLKNALITGNHTNGKCALYAGNTTNTCTGVTVSGFTATNDTGSWAQGGVVNCLYGGNLILSSCTFINNSPYKNYCLGFGYATSEGRYVLVKDCTFGSAERIDLFNNNASHTSMELRFAGSNSLKNRIFNNIESTYAAQKVIIESGAILDLTGNNYEYPINPGGAGSYTGYKNPGGTVTFAPGGATVYPSAGSASAYVLDGVTVPAIGNGNVVNLGGTNVLISSGATASASGCTFSGGSAETGGAVSAANNTDLNFTKCNFIANSCTKNGGAAFVYYSANAMISGGTMTGNVASNGGAFYLGDGAIVSMSSCTITSNTASNGGGLYTNGAVVTVESSIISGNTAPAGADVYLLGGTFTLTGGNTIGSVAEQNDAVVALKGNNTVVAISSRSTTLIGSVIISSGASIALTNSIAPGGGITVLTGGCTVNGASIAAGTYTQIVSSGGSAVAS